MNWEYGERPEIIEYNVFKPSGKFYTCDRIRIPHHLCSIINDVERRSAIRAFLDDHFAETPKYRNMTIVIDNTKRQDLIGWPMMILPRENA